MLAVVQRFDMHLVPLIKSKNTKEHKVMSTLFDFISNIKTVITLRFEKSATRVLQKNIQEIIPPYMKFAKLNEWKWFSMDMSVSVVIAVILGWYVYEQYTLGSTVLI